MVNSVEEILEASEQLVQDPRPFWEIFISGLTGKLSPFVLNLLIFRDYEKRDCGDMVYYGVKHHGLYAVGSDSKRTDLGPSYRDASFSLLFCIFRYVSLNRDSYCFF